MSDIGRARGFGFSISWMAHSTSAAVALLLAVLAFAAMQAFRTQLASSQASTLFGGFVGSNIFLFLLTAVSNFEMDTFGDTFQSKLVPEVVICLGVSMFASALVHRVCVTTCFIFSMILLYCMSKISNERYAPHVSTPAVVAVKKKK